jgi:hypothetical protein
VNVVAFLFSFVLFSFGIWVMSVAFQVVGFEAPVFFSGIVAVSLSFGIPFHVLGKADGA